MGWASAESFAAISSFVLEQGYGCTTTIIPTDTVPAVTSLAENNEPDIVLEVWKNSAPAYPGLVEEGKVITASSIFKSGGNEGWWVPKYLVDEHPELATIEGVLANPDLVGGKFHNCPVGWGCRLVNDNLKVVHDLAGNGFEVFDHGSGANLGAALAAAYEEKAPWFGYYWGPTAVLGKYEMVEIDIGPIDPEIHAENQKENADPNKIGVSGFPSAPVLNAMTSSFAEREPEVAEFIKNFEIPNPIISEMLAWKEANNASADETAAYVLQNHKDVILGMVNDSAREKLNALL
jgi:glycine betaine/proline transport system substrate-binding protein